MNFPIGEILKWAGVAASAIESLGPVAETLVEVTPELREKLKAERRKEEDRWAS